MCSENISHKRKDEISAVADSTFYIFKEPESLFLYGESLNLWLSIGGIIKGNVEIIREDKKIYYRGVISPAVFFGFIYNKTNLFDVTSICFGYKVKVKVNEERKCATHLEQARGRLH
ncbi:hypothetical protein [Aeromonas veronii]|uniref:hypothetical protein n=1 Tax=Aeromonas veronii TaxID=654 RepID=UPI00111929A0|nr:hypothetical protein [Aeromonas veronii]TNI12502.1 hypothetical protein CF106_11035 [Aeromonas veronii]